LPNRHELRERLHERLEHGIGLLLELLDPLGGYHELGSEEGFDNLTIATEDRAVLVLLGDVVVPGIVGREAREAGEDPKGLQKRNPG
jgi:hypothetical protein